MAATVNWSIPIRGGLCEELVMLESEGVEIFDAKSLERVLIVAPLMIVICNKLRTSELVSHLGSSANKYWRICGIN